MSTATAPLGHNNPPTPIELLVKQLDLVTAEDRAKIDELVKTPIPETIADDVEAAKFTDLTGEIQRLYNRYEKKREIEKAPHYQAGVTVDNYFKPGKNALDLLKAQISRPLIAYAKKKAEDARIAAAAEQARLQAIAEAEAAKARELEKAGLQEHAEVQLHQAMKTEASAIKVGNQTTAKLSTVRGSSSMGGLRTNKVLRLTNKEQLDLNALRPYLKPADLQTALNAYFAANGTAIAGSEIVEESSMSVR